MVDFLESQIFHITFIVYVINEYFKPLNFQQLVQQIIQNINYEILFVVSLKALAKYNHLQMMVC